MPSSQNNKPCTIWLTGPSGAGKTTTGNCLSAKLESEFNIPILRLDGDIFRFNSQNTDLSKIQTSKLKLQTGDKNNRGKTKNMMMHFKLHSAES